MEISPLTYVRECPWRKAAGDCSIPDRDDDFKLSVRGVEVRWFVIPVQDGNRNSEKAADDRHFGCPVAGYPMLSCPVTKTSSALWN